MDTIYFKLTKTNDAIIIKLFLKSLTHYKRFDNTPHFERHNMSTNSSAIILSTLAWMTVDRADIPGTSSHNLVRQYFYHSQRPLLSLFRLAYTQPMHFYKKNIFFYINLKSIYRRKCVIGLGKTLFK